MPKIHGIELPSELDPITGEVWGSDQGLSTLRLAIAQYEYGLAELTMEFLTADVPFSVGDLGILYVHLGLHLRVLGASEGLDTPLDTLRRKRYERS